MGSAGRLEFLEERFAAAVAAIEGGASPAGKHTLVAQAALTAMRPELHASAEGRARHRRYELQLERAVGDGRPVAEGVMR